MELVWAAEAINVTVDGVVVVGERVHVLVAFRVNLFVNVMMLEAAVGVIVDELRLPLTFQPQVVSILV